MGPIDVVINNELQRHVLHPGGIVGEIRLWCDACQRVIQPSDVTDHLQRAITRALTTGSK